MTIDLAFPFNDLSADDPNVAPVLKERFAAKTSASMNLVAPNSDASSVLQDLQANIVRPHVRDCATLILLRFKSVEGSKKFLAELSKEMKSATEHIEEVKLYKQRINRESTEQIASKLLINVMLSASGYRKLGFNAKAFEDLFFQRGMRKASLDDQTGVWDKYWRRNIHALILIAGPGRAAGVTERVDALTRKIELLGKSKVGPIEHVKTEQAKTYRNSDYSVGGVEHFGFADGISNPRFFVSDVATFDSGYDKWNPLSALNAVLRKDPFSGQNAYGSLVVYRKLEQNVRGFWQKVSDLAKVSGDSDLVASTRLLGRTKNGYPPSDLPHSGRNNFNYTSDPNGGLCPFHSHVRKANPRQTDFNRTLIARRGITYGNREVHPLDEQSFDKMPTTGVGLLFLAFMNRTSQFMKIQASWANSPSFPKDQTGIDPFIGQCSQDKADQRGQRYILPHDLNAEPVVFDFSGFVTAKGGEFFFAPSLSFLAGLWEPAEDRQA